MLHVFISLCGQILFQYHCEDWSLQVYTVFPWLTLGSRVKVRQLVVTVRVRVKG